MSVRECKRQVDSQEFTRWIQYFRTVPSGDDALQYAVSVIVSAIYNASDKRKHSGGQFEPREFVMDFWESIEKADTKLEIALKQCNVNRMLHNSRVAERKQ